jgi:hypothetical protein
MNSGLLRLKVDVLYECVKGFIERSDKSSIYKKNKKQKDLRVHPKGLK